MDINIDIPFRLSFNHLDSETQEKLIEQSKEEVERESGSDIRAYADENYLDYETLLEEEAIKNLYNYKFKFTI